MTIVLVFMQYEKEKIIPKTKILNQRKFMMQHTESFFFDIEIQLKENEKIDDFFENWMGEYLKKKDYTRRNDHCRLAIFDVAAAEFSIDLGNLKKKNFVKWSICVHLEGWEDEWNNEWEIKPPNRVTDYFKRNELQENINSSYLQLQKAILQVQQCDDETNNRDEETNNRDGESNAKRRKISNND